MSGVTSSLFSRPDRDRTSCVADDILHGLSETSRPATSLSSSSRFTCEESESSEYNFQGRFLAGAASSSVAFNLTWHQCQSLSGGVHLSDARTLYLCYSRPYATSHGLSLMVGVPPHPSAVCIIQTTLGLWQPRMRNVHM